MYSGRPFLSTDDNNFKIFKCSIPHDNKLKKKQKNSPWWKYNYSTITQNILWLLKLKLNPLKHSLPRTEFKKCFLGQGQF